MLSKITPELKAGMKVKMGLTLQWSSLPPPRARGQRLFPHSGSILHCSKHRREGMVCKKLQRKGFTSKKDKGKISRSKKSFP